MKQGDKVKVVDQPELRGYPFMPNLIGKIGTIDQVVTESPVAHDPLDEPLYYVRMNNPFKAGVVPDGSTAFNYQPTEFRNETTWVFLSDEIEQVE